MIREKLFKQLRLAKAHRLPYLLDRDIRGGEKLFCHRQLSLYDILLDSHPHLLTENFGDVVATVMELLTDVLHS